MLNEKLLTQLQTETFILLHTHNLETTHLTSNAISWAYAMDEKRIRFCLDQRSRLIDNLRQTSNATLTVFAEDTVYAIMGDVKMVAEPLSEVPMKVVCFELDVQEVRESMFYGARLKNLPKTEKTYNPRAAQKLDQQVFAALKKA